MHLSYNLQKTKAVLVGISEYENDFAPILPAKNNVIALADILTDKEIFGIPKNNITTLINVENNEIVETIEDIVENDDLDTFIFYYAGHGYRPKKGKLYLTGSNSINAVRRIKYTGIEYDDLKDLIEKAGKKRIVIIDACYSGIAAQDDNIGLEDPEKIISGTYVMTSAPKDEQALFDTDGEFTFFTEELINTFKKGSEQVDDCFSLNDIYSHVEKRLRVGKKPEPQRKDNLNIKNEDFKFAKNKLFNKDILISKVESYYKKQDYKKALETIEIINKRYKVKRLQKIYKDCNNQIDYEAKYKKSEKAYEENQFELAFKIAHEALLIKEDIRNIELRQIIEECRIRIDLKKSLSKEYEEKIKSKEDEILSLKLSLTKKIETVKLKEKEKQQLKKEITKTENKATTYEKEIREKELIIEEKNANEANLAKELSKYKIDFKAFKEGSEKQNEINEKSIQSLENELADKKNIIIEVREELQIAQKDIQDYRTEEALLNTKIHQLEQRLETAIKELKQKGGAASDVLKKENEELLNEIIDWEEKNKILTKVVEENKVELEENKNTIEELRTQILPERVLTQRKNELRALDEKIRRRKEKATRRK